MIITSDKILAYGPSYRSNMDVRALIGNGKSPVEILDLDISDEFKVWILTLPGAMTDDQLTKLLNAYCLSIRHLFDETSNVITFLETGIIYKEHEDQPYCHSAWMMLDSIYWRIKHQKDVWHDAALILRKIIKEI